MPHLVLEYSSNVRETADPKTLFLEIHKVLIEVGDFRLPDFKSRAIKYDLYFIGDGTIEQAFVNLDIRTFGGKTADTKQKVIQAALNVLSRYFAKTMKACHCDISVQITELERASYSCQRSADVNSA